MTHDEIKRMTDLALVQLGLTDTLLRTVDEHASDNQRFASEVLCYRRCDPHIRGLEQVAEIIKAMRDQLISEALEGCTEAVAVGVR